MLQLFILNFSLTFGTGYGHEHIGLEFYLGSKYNGSVICVPSVPSNNSSFFQQVK